MYIVFDWMTCTQRRKKKHTQTKHKQRKSIILYNATITIKWKKSFAVVAHKNRTQKQFDRLFRFHFRNHQFKTRKPPQLIYIHCVYLAGQITQYRAKPSLG